MRKIPRITKDSTKYVFLSALHWRLQNTYSSEQRVRDERFFLDPMSLCRRCASPLQSAGSFCRNTVWLDVQFSQETNRCAKFAFSFALGICYKGAMNTFQAGTTKRRDITRYAYIWNSFRSYVCFVCMCARVKVCDIKEYEIWTSLKRLQSYGSEHVGNIFSLTISAKEQY